MVSTQCGRVRRNDRSGSFHASKKIDYGLYFLAFLERHGGPCSARSIAKEGGLSFSFMQKIAHLLKRAGVVDAQRGKEGGYRLARPAHVITMGDVIGALDGMLTSESCLPHMQRACPQRTFCELRTTVSRIKAEVARSYLSKKLSEFIVAD